MSHWNKELCMLHSVNILNNLLDIRYMSLSFYQRECRVDKASRVIYMINRGLFGLLSQTHQDINFWFESNSSRIYCKCFLKYNLHSYLDSLDTHSILENLKSYIILWGIFGNSFIFLCTILGDRSSNQKVGSKRRILFHNNEHIFYPHYLESNLLGIF